MTGHGDRSQDCRSGPLPPLAASCAATTHVDPVNGRGVAKRRPAGPKDLRQADL